MGQCAGERGPGPVFLIPLLDRVIKVDIRIHTMKVPHEKCLTKDNLMIDTDMVLYWWVQRPEWSTTRIANLDDSLHLLATALLHDIIIQYRSGEVQLQREQINELLRNKIEKTSSAWGIFTDVEIRDIKPPAEIITLMQLQAAAEWKRQITVAEAEGYRDAQKVKAEGDAAALEKLNQAAAKVDEKLLVIRHLETLHELGKSAATKFILPVELIDLVRPIANKLRWEEVPIPDSQPNKPSKDGQSGK
jgi:regulator of protease activity HflC (stomatin/prohibitin superfamily)